MTKEINDKVASEWLDSQKHSTKLIYKSVWGKFAAYTKMTGADILADRRTDKDAKWEKLVLAFKAHLQAQGLSSYTATTAVMGIRGFFAYYRLPLQYRRTESKRLGERSRKTEDYRFTLNDIRALYEQADLQEKYVIAAGKSFGLRAGDFLRLTVGDLQPYLDKEPPISIGSYKTEKESVTSYPFIDADAKPIIKLVLEKLARQGRTKASDKILQYSDGIQLSRVIKRCAQKAGLNTGGKQLRFHCLRKFLSDHLSSVMAESKWKQIIGKKISEGAYVSPDSLRADYSRVMAETCFTTSGVDERLKALEDFKKDLTPEMLEKGKRAGLLFRKAKIDERAQAEIEKELAKEKDCEDGEHCGETFKQVNESDLLAHLREGWEIAYKLQSGDIIVKR